MFNNLFLNKKYSIFIIYINDNYYTFNYENFNYLIILSKYLLVNCKNSLVYKFQDVHLLSKHY